MLNKHDTANLANDFSLFTAAVVTCNVLFDSFDFAMITSPFRWIDKLPLPFSIEINFIIVIFICEPSLLCRLLQGNDSRSHAKRYLHQKKRRKKRFANNTNKSKSINPNNCDIRQNTFCENEQTQQVKIAYFFLILSFFLFFFYLLSIHIYCASQHTSILITIIILRLGRKDRQQRIALCRQYNIDNTFWHLWDLKGFPLPARS